MSEFGDLEKKAQAYAEEHPEQADQGVNEVAGIAEHDTDHQHDEQIDRAVDAAEQHRGRGERQAGSPADGAAGLHGLDLRHDLLFQPLEVVERLRHRHVGERRPDEQHRQPGLLQPLEVVGDLRSGAHQ